MAKRERAGALDGAKIIRAFKEDDLLADPEKVVKREEPPQPESEQPETLEVEETEAVEEVEIHPEEPLKTVEPSSKGKSRRKRGNYDEVFLKKKELKTRQPVYISLDIHESIKELVHMLALTKNEISVGGYIDNVLAEHLEQHKDEVIEMYLTKVNKKFNK